MRHLISDCTFLLFLKFGDKMILSVLVPILKVRHRALEGSNSRVVWGRWVLPEYCSREGYRVEVRIPRHATGRYVASLWNQVLVLELRFWGPNFGSGYAHFYCLSTFLMFFEKNTFLQRTTSSRDKGPNWESQCAAPLLSFYFLFCRWKTNAHYFCYFCAYF